MSLADFATRLKLVVDELNATREEDAILIGKESIALVRLRVQNDKVDSNGNSFGSYSQALVPQWYFYGKSLSQGAEDRVKSGDWFQSYEDLRLANNLPVDAKNFTFSGEMWKNIGVTAVNTTGTSVTVTIGGQTQSAADKLSYQEPDNGNIIELNEQEERYIQEAAEERIIGIINKYLG